MQLQDPSAVPPRFASLIACYEEAYVMHLEAAEGAVDLEERADIALRLNRFDQHMRRAGFAWTMTEIQASYRFA